MKIACGSFYGWLGQPVPVVPELGMGFDVRPDDRAREVARARDDHAFIREVLNRGACWLELPLDMESPLDTEPPSGFSEELARLVAVTIRAGVRENWQELRAIDEQIEAITEEYGGEDVLHARVRGNLDEAKALLLRPARGAAGVHGTVRSPGAGRGDPRHRPADRRQRRQPRPDAVAGAGSVGRLHDASSSAGSCPNLTRNRCHVQASPKVATDRWSRSIRRDTVAPSSESVRARAHWAVVRAPDGQRPSASSSRRASRRGAR